MKISQIVAKLQSIAQEHGDLDCFDQDNFEVSQLYFEEIDPSDFPEDWNMPQKLVRIGQFK